MRKVNKSTREMATKRLIRQIFPVIPVQAIERGRAKKNIRASGRPRGSVTYSIPGVGKVGVFEYRRWLSAQKQLARMRALERQRAIDFQRIQQQVQQSGGQMPTEEQLIAEEQGQVIQSPQPQLQQQMPQSRPFQYVQEKKPITTIFKSSGGKPYPAVDTTPLQGDRFSEYYEVADPFSGQRRLVRRPQAEAWIRPK